MAVTKTGDRAVAGGKGWQAVVRQMPQCRQSGRQLGSPPVAASDSSSESSIDAATPTRAGAELASSRGLAHATGKMECAVAFGLVLRESHTWNGRGGTQRRPCESVGVKACSVLDSRASFRIVRMHVRTPHSGGWLPVVIL